MKKWLISLCCLLSVYGFSEEDSDYKNLTPIAKEIQALEDKLHEIQLLELKEEVEGQELMIADWPAFAKKVEAIKKLEEEERQLLSRIKRLKEVQSNSNTQSKM